MRIRKLAGLLGLAAVVATLTAAQAPEKPAFALKPLGNGVWAAIAAPRSKAGANAGFIVGSDGVVVVDTFVNPEPARDLLAEIRKITNLPIRFVINTHYHLDHVAGNGVFAEAGAVILAHRNVRPWIRTENKKFFGADIKPEQTTMVESLAQPQVVYDDGVDLFLGSRRIVVRSMPGHTGGDSLVVIPDANVVFCGDLFWRNTLPNLIDASTREWAATLEAVTSREKSATFVPGHGEVGDVSDVANFRQYLLDLRAAIGAAQAAGKSGDAVVDAVLPGLQEKYGSWGAFAFFSKPDILRTAEEMSGQKKLPSPAAEWYRFSAHD